jgi:predicted CoA-binding protein
MAHENPDAAAIRSLLKSARRIAVVGLSPKPHRDSNRIGRYLLAKGYAVIPVYPRETEILGQPVFRRVQDIPGTVDLVDVFRRSEELANVTEDALQAKAKALWFQLDCVDEASALLARAAGLTVVMDRCIMVDHAHLIG